MFKVTITSNTRFLLAIFWSILTVILCYTFLFLGLTFFGEGQTADLIIGDMYTFTPALMAIIFIIVFKTDTLNWDKFHNPGIKWLSFGVGYTIIVLFLTIVTGFMIGGFQVNPSYNPFNGDLQGFTTNIQLLDLILFFIVVGVLLLFSPGGFVRIVGEEFGWRGYLFPELLKLHPRLQIVISTFIVGFVWFSFHIPYFTVLAPVPSDKIIFLILGSLGVFLGANWAMTWAYLKTKSIWPAMVLHYSWNLIAPIFTGNLYDGSLGLLNPSIDNIWLVNGEGLIGGFFHFLVGLIFLFLIIKDKNILNSEYNDKIENEIYNKKLPKRIKLN